MITFKLHPGPIATCQELINTINTAEKKVRAQHTEIKWLFVEPDYVE